MDLSRSAAIGSSISGCALWRRYWYLQAFFLDRRPMVLLFTPSLVIAVLWAVLVTGQIAGDGPKGVVCHLLDPRPAFFLTPQF